MRWLGNAPQKGVTTVMHTEISLQRASKAGSELLVGESHGTSDAKIADIATDSTSHNPDISQALARAIKKDAENADYSAKSLYEEWPEYDPANRFDREDKIAEIRRRPTRKEKFGTLSQDPWVTWRPERSQKTIFILLASEQHPSLEGENLAKGEVVKCNTFDELFGIPAETEVFLCHGNIAYREVIRKEDGSVCKPATVYSTGYL